MCQASSTIVSTSKSAVPAVNLRKPVLPAATFRLSMRRDQHHRESHLLSPSSSSSSPTSVTSHPLTLRYRALDDDVSPLQCLKPTWLSFDDDEDEAILPIKESGSSVLLLTPKKATSVPDRDTALRCLSPPLLGPSSTEDEYRSITSLPEAILIPDF